jgi:hypothetical protein
MAGAAGHVLDPGALYAERRIEQPGGLDAFAIRLLGRARDALPRQLWARSGAVALALADAQAVAAVDDAARACARRCATWPTRRGAPAPSPWCAKRRGARSA